MERETESVCVTEKECANREEKAYVWQDLPLFFFFEKQIDLSFKKQKNTSK